MNFNKEATKMAVLLRNDPKPTPQPPVTFDLAGLSSQEVQMLRDLVGSIPCGLARKHYQIDTTPLYMALNQYFGALQAWTISQRCR